MLFDSGRGLPPPSFGQCPKENIFFPRGVPLLDVSRKQAKVLKATLVALSLLCLVTLVALSPEQAGN